LNRKLAVFVRWGSALAGLAWGGEQPQGGVVRQLRSPLAGASDRPPSASA
jgi:hypothetical protein